MPDPARLIFLGAVGLDTILAVPALPTGPGKFLPTAMVQVAEGMAASAAATAARLGGRASLWGRVGDDATGARIREELARDGVEVSGLRAIPAAHSVVSTILVAPDGERIIVPFYDPALGSDTNWLDLASIKSADAVQADVRWPEGARAILSEARKAGVTAVLDADTGPVEIIAELAALASHAVFSEPAAASLAGAHDPAESTRILARRFEGFIAVTAGADGCFWFDRQAGDVRHLPAPRVTAIDTLAAGDVFHGAFTLMLAEGRSEPEAIRFASAAAAIKCTRFGGRLGAPTRDEVEALLTVAE